MIFLTNILFSIVYFFEPMLVQATDWTPIGFIIHPNNDSVERNKNFCLAAPKVFPPSGARPVSLLKCDHSNLDKVTIWSSDGTDNTNKIYNNFSLSSKSVCIVPKKIFLKVRLCQVGKVKKREEVCWNKSGMIRPCISNNVYTVSEVADGSVVTLSPPQKSGDAVQNWEWVPVYQKGTAKDGTSLYATLDSVKLHGHTPFSYQKQTHPGFMNPGNVGYVYEQDDDDSQQADGLCSPDQKTRLDFAVRYMRAASVSHGFEFCLRNAVYSGVNLGTSHEAPRVGPYVPCNGYDPDPVLPNKNIGYGVVMNVLRANKGTTGYAARRIYHKCTNEPWYLFTARSPVGGVHQSNRWDWEQSFRGYSGDQKTHLIEWSTKFHTREPTHAVGEYVDPLFGDLGSYSYPVDELAGIILHEMLHNTNFNHGPADDKNACGYDTWSCPGGSSYGSSCRMNSLLEIAEACMSEIVQLSTDNCDPLMCDGGGSYGSDEVPIYEIVQKHDCDDDDADPGLPGCGEIGFLGGKCRCTRFW